MILDSSHKQRCLTVIATALVILFCYTAVSKLLDMNEFEKQLANQNIPAWSVGLLLWLIPGAELLVSLLLLYSGTRKSGLIGSLLLMFAFTAYVALVVFNVFERVPCSCGGVLKQLGFKAHLAFNLVFLALTVLGLYLSYKNGKEVL